MTTLQLAVMVASLLAPTKSCDELATDAYDAAYISGDQDPDAAWEDAYAQCEESRP